MARGLVPALLAAVPTLACGIQHHGAAASNSTQGSGHDFTLATWNVLSVSKCGFDANGFVGMDENAYAAHNKLEPEDECNVAKPPATCASAWIQKMIPEIMEKQYSVDVMFVQEIDWPMLLGLRKLGDAYGIMPITGTATQKDIEAKLEKEKREEKPGGKPAGDTAYVVWRKTSNHGTNEVACRMAGKTVPAKTVGGVAKKAVEMDKVGYCSIKRTPPKGTGTPVSVHVIGMHGDGDAGFTAEQSHIILDEQGDRSDFFVDAVLGDLNRGTRGEVAHAVSPLNRHLVVPDSGEKTVYRVVHQYRKLAQALQNSKILKGPEATCAAIPDETYTEKKEDGTEETKTRKNKGMVSWCSDIDLVAKTKDMKENELSEELREKLGKGKLVGLFKKIAGTKLWDTIAAKDYPWTEFPAEIGLNNNLGVEDTKTAKTYMKAEVTREDWVAYDENKFELLRAVVPYEAELRSVSEIDTGKASVKAKYPIEAMASDHLPVIMKLKIKPGAVGDTGRKGCSRAYKRFIRKILRTLGYDGLAHS